MATRRAEPGSSEAIGSSAMISSAPCTSVRAIAARCCCPPESSDPRLSACSAMPTRPSACMARCLSSSVNLPSVPLMNDMRPSAPMQIMLVRTGKPCGTRLNWLEDHAGPGRANPSPSGAMRPFWLHRPSEQRDGAGTCGVGLGHVLVDRGPNLAMARINVDSPEPEAPIKRHHLAGPEAKTRTLLRDRRVAVEMDFDTRRTSTRLSKCHAGPPQSDPG